MAAIRKAPQDASCDLSFPTTVVLLRAGGGHEWTLITSRAQINTKDSSFWSDLSRIKVHELTRGSVYALRPREEQTRVLSLAFSQEKNIFLPGTLTLARDTFRVGLI